VRKKKPYTKRKDKKMFRIIQYTNGVHLSLTYYYAKQLNQRKEKKGKEKKM